ncbi:MAG: phosphocholine cytidylyltransferase family protein [Myxococcales bacterium]|nr:phosphocholine cytidylyltransferase family protein [Myxococcales bacterium]
MNSMDLETKRGEPRHPHASLDRRPPRRALILAAGVGRRLRPHTLTRPKCLVEVGGVSLLHLLLEALYANGIDEWVIVTGYRAEMIREAVDRWEFRPHILRWVDNPRYEVTNTLYSVALAAPMLAHRGFVLVNADLWIEASELHKLVTVDARHAMLVDTEVALDAEAMKVGVDRRGRIVAISKQLTRGVGESIGAYRFDSDTGRRFLDRVARGVAEERSQDYYEHALDDLYGDGLRAELVRVASRRWVEIDDHRDLERARACIAAARQSRAWPNELT